MYKMAINSFYQLNKEGQIVEAITRGRYYKVLQQIGGRILFKGNQDMIVEFYANENTNGNQYEYFDKELFADNISLKLNEIAQMVENKLNKQVKWVKVESIFENDNKQNYRALLLIHANDNTVNGYIRLIKDDKGNLIQFRTNLNHFIINSEKQYEEFLQEVGDFTSFDDCKGCIVKFYSPNHSHSNQIEYAPQNNIAEDTVHIDTVAKVVSTKFNEAVKWVRVDVFENNQKQNYQALLLVSSKVDTSNGYVKLINDQNGELDSLETNLEHYVFNWDVELVDDCFLVDGIKNGILTISNPRTRKDLPHSEVVSLVLGQVK